MLCQSQIRRIVVGLILLASPVAVLAHTGESLDRNEILRAWTWNPVVVFALLVTMVLYVVGAARMRSRSERNIQLWRVACFVTGWCALVAALVSPLHRLGSVLFSAHMGQH